MAALNIFCIQHFAFWFIMMFSFLGCRTDSSSVQLASGNIDEVLRNNELVLVNFYADWCRFSQMLAPVYDSAAQKIKQEFPAAGKVVFGKVDCDKETSIAQQYHVNKYPTIKMFRQGSLVKREYRGQRSADAISSFIREQLRDIVKRVENLEELDDVDRKKRNIFGYFADDTGPDFQAFMKVASHLRDDCIFYAAIGTVSQPERIAGNKIVFRPPGDSSTELTYGQGGIKHDLLQQWATDKCVPFVREITFENAEELTEEGLPFMILFHAQDDTETPEKFRKTVSASLIAEKSSVNFLTADGSKFTHPLYHLGKTVKDLPILAIDSFRHMYLWKRDPKTDLETPGLLKQFIADLHSGKLHREFHHGPDPTTTESPASQSEDGAGAMATISHSDVSRNVVHMNVQQQVVMHSDGTRVQIVRLVQLGPQQPVDQLDFYRQMMQLEQNTPDDDTDDDDDNDDDDDDDEEEEEGIEGDELLEDFDQKFGAVMEKMPNNKAESSIEGQGKLPNKLEHQSDHRGIDGQRYKVFQQHQKLQPHDGPSTVFDKISEIKVKSLLTEQEYESDRTNPPESIFQKLAPSRQRYTLLKDEL